MKTEEKQKSMIRAIYKPVSASIRLSRFLDVRLKVSLAAMKAGSDNLIDSPGLLLNASGDVIRCSEKFCMACTASVAKIAKV